MHKKREEKASEGGFELGLGGILKGWGDLVEKLGDLKESGEQLSRSGEIHGLNKEVKGMYGFTVKMGLGDDRPQIEPFGNIQIGIERKRRATLPQRRNSRLEQGSQGNVRLHRQDGAGRRPAADRTLWQHSDRN